MTTVKPKRWSNKRLTNEQFVEKATALHGGKYNYDKSVYVNSTIKVIITCPEHGDFLQTPNKHLANRGCPKCKNSLWYYTEDFIRKAKEVHGDRYDYSEVEYHNSTTKVAIRCKKHGIFMQEPRAHFNNQGCPLCKIPIGEARIIKYLTARGIEFEREKTFAGCSTREGGSNLRFDFYLPSHNLLIEYNGIHHYEPFSYTNRQEPFEVQQANYEGVVLRDNVKKNYADEHDIKLLTISYLDAKRLFDILDYAIA